MKKSKIKSEKKSKSKIVSNLIRYVFVAGNIFAAIILIFSAFSDQIPPEHGMVYASYFGLVYPFICAFNLFFIIYWIFAKRWFIFISLFAFLICWEPTHYYFPLNTRKSLPEGDIIKVLTYNVMGFAHADHTDASPNKIVQYIAGSDADIVCLQEYFVYKSGAHLTEKKLHDALPMYPYYSVVRLRDYDWGIAILSKYPILSSRRINYKSRTNGSSIHLINVNGKTLTLINNHLESFKLTSEDRSKYSDFVTGSMPESFGELRVIQQKLGPAFMIRAQQARIVAEEIRRIRSDYTIVCGDFNDTPISYSIHTVRGSLEDAYVDSGWGAGATYNQNYFWFRIDHIFHSANMKAYNCTIDKVKYSDHYPLWCYFKLN